MGIWRQISQYFYFRKPDKPETKWIGYMHWINRICFFMFILCMIFLLFFAVDVQMLLAGYILCGLPWGVFQTLTTTYAAEVTPVGLRAYLTSYVNLCWVSTPGYLKWLAE